MNYLILLSLITSFLSLSSASGDDHETSEADKFHAHRHPLDPLTPAEIHRTSLIIRKHNNSATWIFNRINLYEPEKSKLLKFYLKNRRPRNIPRKSFAVLLNSKTFAAVEVVVNLNSRRVESWSDLPVTHQPATNRPDRNLAENIVKDDVDVQERCRRLGWSNMSLVAADIWPVGYVGDRDDLHPENRLVQSFFYGKIFPEDNEYAHPFDFIATVDLRNEKIVSIEDLPTGDDSVEVEGDYQDEPNPVPLKQANYDYNLRGGKDFLRSDLHPVKISQPGGPSFTVKGFEVQWQKFQFRIGFNEREGLIIHQVGYHDNNLKRTEKGKAKSQFRPLFYRLSLSETFIPYGDSRPPYHRKGAYDMGELDIGISANELNSDDHCLGENVKFFDVFINDPHGEPLTLKNAICVYEEDNGVLWKHTDYRTGYSSITRSQRLTVAFLATIGNYDYLFMWHFYQDAKIEYEVRLTGILSTNFIAPSASTMGHGTLVSEQVNAQYHQHIFAMRIDADIDGERNTVGTLDVVPSPPEEAPYRQAFTTKFTPFKTANNSKTYGSAELSRSWLVMGSKENLNPYSGSPTSYKLIPKHLSRFIVQPSSPLYPKAEFSEYDVWVTPYMDGELYAGGRYLNGSGIPEWVRNSEGSIEENDIVLWHIFRVDHVTRVEDYPVMPNESAGFTLKPNNFFHENPGLDVPPPKG